MNLAQIACWPQSILLMHSSLVLAGLSLFTSLLLGHTPPSCRLIIRAWLGRPHERLAVFELITQA